MIKIDEKYNFSLIQILHIIIDKILFISIKYHTAVKIIKFLTMNFKRISIYT